MKIKLFFILLTIVFKSLGQSNIPIGTWRIHFNYQKAIALEKANQKIYCLTEQGLFYFDTEENSIGKLSKVDGLSDVNITAIGYSMSLDILAIGYSNGNIDLVSSVEIFNISTIKKSSITDDKRINHIAFNEGKVYLSTNFGVLVLDPNTGEIGEVFQNLGEDGNSIIINQTLFDTNTIYLASSEGVLSADLNSGLNLRDFNNWERFDGSVVSGISINALALANGEIYASSTTDIFRFNNTFWIDLAFNSGGESIIRIKDSTNDLIVVTESTIQSRAIDGSIEFFDLEIGDQPSDVLVENDQTFWFADIGKGLSKGKSGTIERIAPNGVFNFDISRLEFINNSIFAFPKSSFSSSQPQNNELGYAQFNNGNWSNIPPESILNIDDISDAISLNEEDLILSSFGHGVADLRRGILYDESNSPLVNNDISGRNVLVSAMDSDQEGNIWVSQVASNSLLKLTPDGTWEAFDPGINTARNPLNIKTDDLGQIWIQPQPGFEGMVGYNPETRAARHFTTSNSSLPDFDVTDLELDQEGQVWIGTDRGLVFLPFTFGAIDDNSIDLITPIFGNRVLFDGEKINAIEVDAGNRKWIATNEGLWLFEDDGDVLIHNFTTENSPLPSNLINDLKINSETGEIFISTEKGLVSFRSDAVQGNAFHQTVKIFPNPVTPGYSGLVGITGLAVDVTLKITDVSGKLVREINAVGGGASWNLADYNGVRAETGIYLIFSSNDDGSETFVGKIAVVN